MTYILLLIIMNSSGSSVAAHSVEFSSSATCLKALGDLVESEKYHRVTGRCVTK
jgi:hypothetical protein